MCAQFNFDLELCLVCCIWVPSCYPDRNIWPEMDSADVQVLQNLLSTLSLTSTIHEHSLRDLARFTQSLINHITQFTPPVNHICICSPPCLTCFTQYALRESQPLLTLSYCPVAEYIVDCRTAVANRGLSAEIKCTPHLKNYQIREHQHERATSAALSQITTKKGVYFDQCYSYVGMSITAMLQLFLRSWR